jgi:two-component system chemotaxis response regulator CheB
MTSQPKHSVNRTPTVTCFQAVVIGVSAGGMKALSTLLPILPKDFPLPILVVQHRLAGSDDYITKNLNQICALQVKEAEEKEALKAGCVYIAPADYHLLVERDETLSLSVDEKVNYSRPAIDVLFESAAYVWSSGLIGIVLTGANSDGAKGLASIKQQGGTAIVQNPETAEHSTMPKAALASADYVLDLKEIGKLLNALTTQTQNLKSSRSN